MRALEKVPSKLYKINPQYDCNLMKNVSYVPDKEFIKMRGFCLPDEDICQTPIKLRLYQDCLNEPDDCQKQRLSCPAILIDLRLPFWLNELSFDIPLDSHEKCAYVLEYSVDGEEWKLLFDYTKYACSSNQLLFFQPTVVRFFRFSGIVRHPLKMFTLRFVKSLNNLKAHFRPIHNAYNYGLRQGLYHSPYHIYSMKIGISHQSCRDSLEAKSKLPLPVYLFVSQPVSAKKFHLTIPDGFRVKFNFGIFDHNTKEYDLVYESLNDFPAGEQEILFTERPVNLIKIEIKQIEAYDSHKIEDFVFTSWRFFNFKDLTSVKVNESGNFPKIFKTK